MLRSVSAVPSMQKAFVLADLSEQIVPGLDPFANLDACPALSAPAFAGSGKQQAELQYKGKVEECTF